MNLVDPDRVDVAQVDGKGWAQQLRACFYFTAYIDLILESLIFKQISDSLAQVSGATSWPPKVELRTCIL